MISIQPATQKKSGQGLGSKRKQLQALNACQMPGMRWPCQSTRQCSKTSCRTACQFHRAHVAPPGYTGRHKNTTKTMIQNKQGRAVGNVNSIMRLAMTYIGGVKDIGGHRSKKASQEKQIIDRRRNWKTSLGVGNTKSLDSIIDKTNLVYPYGIR